MYSHLEKSKSIHFSRNVIHCTLGKCVWMAHAHHGRVEGAENSVVGGVGVVTQRLFSAARIAPHTALSSSHTHSPLKLVLVIAADKYTRSTHARRRCSKDVMHAALTHESPPPPGSIRPCVEFMISQERTGTDSPAVLSGLPFSKRFTLLLQQFFFFMKRVKQSLKINEIIDSMIP